MRVLHVYKSYFPETQGGLEEVIRQICWGTGARGVENQVLTLAPRGQAGRIERDEATVRRYRRDLEIASCDVSWPALRALPRLARRVDVVHYHFPWPFADLMHLLGRVRTPSVLTYHSDIVRQRALSRLYAPLMRRFLDRIDSVVATSPNYVASSPVLRRFAQNVQVIPIGLDPGTYPAVDQEVHKRLEARVGRDFFLFLGVLRYYKGLHILLDAVAGTDLPVVIAGAGAEESALRARAADLGLDNVRFLGHVSEEEKVALFDLARAVVFPSHLRSEAFGVALLEGAMFGKPLISTEIGTGTSYINIHGETGWVVPPNDSRSLRQAMSSLARDNELASRLGQGACERYRRVFTSGPSMGERYAELYKRLTVGAVPARPVAMAASRCDD